MLHNWNSFLPLNPIAPGNPDGPLSPFIPSNPSRPGSPASPLRPGNPGDPGTPGSPENHVKIVKKNLKAFTLKENRYVTQYSMFIKFPVFIYSSFFTV